MQLMLRSLRIPTIGACIDIQHILKVFENILKVEGFLKEEAKCEVFNAELKREAILEREKKQPYLGEKNTSICK